MTRKPTALQLVAVLAIAMAAMNANAQSKGTMAAAAAEPAASVAAPICPSGHKVFVVQSHKLEAGGVLATKVVGRDDPLRVRMKDDTQAFASRSAAPAGTTICVRT